MKLFIDTANVTEIREMAWLINGVTTNPTLVAREKRPFKEVIAEICEIVDGPVSAEATGPHWAALIVTPEFPEEVVMEPEKEEGLAFIVRLEVSYAFTIIQRGFNPPKPAGQMTEMEVKGSTTEDGKRMLDVRGAFQNLCEDILVCQVYFEVRNEFGEVILRHELPLDRLVLPHAIRIFSHTFEDVAMSPGEYLVLCIIDFGGDHLVGAQYMATVGESP